ncbi:MAG: hypothetical protein AB1610_08995 [Nitrospirota bacterium]
MSSEYKNTITLHKGRSNKPAVIFIHGLGMDQRIWVNPDEARMLAGRFPLRYLLSEKPEPIKCGTGEKMPDVRYRRFSIGKTKRDLKTSFADLNSLKYTVIAWSQRRPAGPIDIAVSELKKVVEFSKEYTRDGIILIGHSRGGLIARKYLECGDVSIKGLITLATPHHGSTIAKWAEYISPLASVIGDLVHEEDKKKFSYTIDRVLDFIGSKAIIELLPDSTFFRSLKNGKRATIPCFSCGGTNPSLFSLYRWRLKVRASRGIFTWMIEPVELFSIPDILEKVIPKKFYPAELKRGYGDGLVSAQSSRLPWCDNHYDFDVNHASILFDEEVRRKVVEAVAEM